MKASDVESEQRRSALLRSDLRVARRALLLAENKLAEGGTLTRKAKRNAALDDVLRLAAACGEKP